MSLRGLDGISGCHAIPYPGRGHINPMMNVCTLLASEGLTITFVVTEEWLTLLGSGSVPNTPNFRFRSIPNVIPSELTRGSDFAGFVEAVCTKMEAPFDEFLDGLEQSATCIIADTLLAWAVVIGNRRNIPVALLWPMSPSLFSVNYHHHLLVAHGHLPVSLENFSELSRVSDFAGFVEAVFTKMEAPFDQFLDGLEQPATCIIADTLLAWAVVIGNRRNIPVASLWPMSPWVFSLNNHHHLLVAYGHLPVSLENFSDSACPGSFTTLDSPILSEKSSSRIQLAPSPTLMIALVSWIGSTSNNKDKSSLTATPFMGLLCRWANMMHLKI
ncbi:hypothetical protein NE237_010401 [Protea cynaroides]|uniref:UDP-glycosyltransferase n=1 Tax=Protea cynaroides TaxID=273540 RepID=A0A9Q0L069_9MAGN|nr:hypothetical protein NE237_010401 [Protea cynaroides]